MITTARERTARLADLLDREHSAMADFLLALADFDRERLWQDLGYASLFSFLRRELRLSAGAAQYRKTAAELARRYPQVEAGLRDGNLCLSSVIELAKVVTPENVVELVPRFFGLSSRDAAAVAVSIRPVQDPPRREVVTVVPSAVPVAATPSGAAPTVSAHDAAPGLFRAPELDRPVQAVAAPGLAPARPRPPSIEIEPLSAELRRLHVTVSRRLVEKLEAARAALSHSHPGGEAGDILEVGLDLVIERHAKRRGLVEKPRSPKAKQMDPAAARERETSPEPSRTRVERPESRSAPAGASERDDTRGIPARRGGRRREPVTAHVKRAVWLRDGGRCQWPVEGRGICGSTHRLEIDHVVPLALGGPSTVENCRLACGFHNDRAARQVFGDDHMDKFTARGRSSKGAPPGI